MDSEELEKVKEELNEEIILSVTELDEAMYVSMISFAFPVQTLMSYITAKLSGSRFVLRTSAIIDLVIFVCCVTWFYKFEEYTYAENEGFGLSDPPHEYHVFMQAVI